MDGALWIPQMIPSTNQQIPVSRVRPDTALRCSDRVLAAPQNGRKWGGGMPRNDLRAPSRRLFPSPRAIWICLKWEKKVWPQSAAQSLYSHVFPIKKSDVLSVNHGEDSMNLPAHFQSQIWTNRVAFLVPGGGLKLLISSLWTEGACSWGWCADFRKQGDPINDPYRSQGFCHHFPV